MLDFSAASILVAGDVVLDRYWIGDCTRISPEAPVPVVLVRETKAAAGGAANVATNVANLGAKTALVSIIGADGPGDELAALVAAAGVDVGFLRDPHHQTTMKLRIVARNQQVVRADFEETPDREILLSIVALFAEKLPAADAVIFSDYGKGGLTHLRQMMDLVKVQGKRILIDPKGADYTPYHGASVITPNRSELAQVVGRWSTEAEFAQKAFRLRDDLVLDALLVTRSEEGMSLFLGGDHIRLPTVARDVYDVSGAGDTVIATLAAALCVGADFVEAARLANRAAGIVVGKIGTSPITLDELIRG